MTKARASGILLHPTSLPGRFGIGDLGAEAYRFVDFLTAAGQTVWQVLPLGPTGFGDSPYQSFSATAGNPLLIDLEGLKEDGLLSAADLEAARPFPDEGVNYGAVSEFKVSLLTRAFDRFIATGSTTERVAFEVFCRENASWLNDFALFMAVKEIHGGAPWTAWEEGIKARHPEEVARLGEELADEVDRVRFWQYLFFGQWLSLKRYCNEGDIRILGDVPIFVAHDSVDVWAHPELFKLDTQGMPAVMAGVPPDYFSETGQLWGNPIFRWDVLARSGYRWWIDRIRATLRVADLVRLDHFRGFEAYWEVPAGETTAVKGRWVKGPGARFFEALRDALGQLPLFAEDLGTITPEVEALRDRLGLPGMAVLQFAFGQSPGASVHRPHNFDRRLVVYTGTHDNDTAVGWWVGPAEHTTLTAEEIDAEREFARKYLATDGHEIHWDLIRAAQASVADTVIIPLQDVLGLGSEARMNRPGRAGGNWSWRCPPSALSEEIAQRLRELTETYDRI